MAFTPNQVITVKKEMFAWASPDTGQAPFGKFQAGTNLTVVAQTGNVVQVRCDKPPRQER